LLLAELAGSFEIKGVSEGETRRRVFLEEMAWQQQRFGHRNGLHSLHYGLGDGHRLERLRLSVLGLRSFTFSGGAALKDSATSVEAAKSELIGNWLCAYLTQVHNVGDSDVYWRREWFCYLPRQSDIPEYTLICPICESETEWCPVDSPAPEKCEMCGFSQLEEVPSDMLRAVYIQMFLNLSGKGNTTTQ
jgi:hypothetical protein